MKYYSRLFKDSFTSVSNDPLLTIYFREVEFHSPAQSTLRAQGCSGKISQRGDIASAEELRCAILRAEGLALRRGWLFRGAKKCGKVGNIVSKWNLCDTGGNRATRAGLSIARVTVLRVEGDERCAGLVSLVARRSKRTEVGCAEPGPRHLSLGQPMRFTSGETSNRFAVCRRKGQ